MEVFQVSIASGLPTCRPLEYIGGICQPENFFTDAFMLPALTLAVWLFIFVRSLRRMSAGRKP